MLYYCDWFKEYTANLALAVAAGPHTATLVHREPTREFGVRRDDEVGLLRALRSGGVDLVPLPGGYSSVAATGQVASRFCSRSDLSDFDVLHLQPTHDPRFLPAARRLPTVLTLHEPAPRTGLEFGPPSRLKRQAYDTIRNLYRRSADVIVVHTEGAFAGLSDRERRKAVIIPHGVDRRARRRTAESRTILFFGRAAAYKGIDVLLAAMQQVWRTHPAARLRILASPADVTPPPTPDPRVHATWDGYTEGELESALADARAVCMPYLSVTGTGVGSQAYGAGVPIVGSDLEGLRELVAHPDLLVRPGCAPDLARALVAVLDRDYAPPKVAADRTWSAVAEAHLRVYAGLLRGVARRSPLLGRHRTLPREPQAW